jgi:hypothetical protein
VGGECLINVGVSSPPPIERESRIDPAAASRRFRRQRIRPMGRCDGTGTSYLVVRTARGHGNGSSGDVVWPLRSGGSEPPSRRLSHPLKTTVITCLSRVVVPITASGLLGEQPLVKWNNVDKGSRQVSSVTSGKGVALGAGPVGPLRTRADAAMRAFGSLCQGRGALVSGSSPFAGWPRRRALNCQPRTGTDQGNLTV